MAETINVGVLRALLTADTAQFTGGLREADRSLKSFESSTKRYADSLIKSMSEAGRAASASGKLIAGMSAAGREAAAKSAAAFEESAKKASAWQQMLHQSAAASADAEKSFARTADAGGRAGKALASVAGIIAGLNLGRAAAEAASAASTIADTAERLQISTEAVQRLGFAAEQSGSSLEAVATAMGAMAEVLGSEKADEKLRAIGLSFEQIKGLSPEETFTTIADAIGKIPDPLRQSDEATNLFGRSALQLLPAIRAGFTEVGKAAPLMADETVKAGDRVDNKLNEINTRMANLKAEALLPLMDFFTKNLPQGVQVGIAAMTSFIPSLEQVTLGVLALGGPSGAWAAVVSGSKAVVGSFGAIALAARGALVAIWPIAAAIAAIWAAWKLGNTETVKNSIAEWALASDNLTARLFRFVGGIDQMTAAQAKSSVAATAAAESARASAAATGEMEKATAAAVPPVLTLNQKLAEAKIALAALTQEQRQNIAAGLELGKSTAEVAKELGIGEAVVKLYKDSVTAAEKALDAAAKATKKAEQAAEELHQTWKRTVAANTKIFEDQQREAEKLFEREKKINEARTSETLRSIKAAADAEKDLTRVAHDNETKRAEFAIEQARRKGATWQQLYAMERRLSDEQLRHAIANAEEEFRVTTMWIDRTTTFGEQEFQARKRVHDATVRGMVEEHQRAELIKRDELERTHDVWRRTIDSAKDLVRTLGESMSANFAAMIVGAQGFKEGFVGIWKSIQQHLMDILNDLLNFFISSFLKGMLGAILGQQGAFSNAFAGLFSGGGGGGIPGTGGAGGGIVDSLVKKGASAALKFLGFGGGTALIGGSTAATAVASTAVPAAIFSQGASIGIGAAATAGGAGAGAGAGAAGAGAAGAGAGGGGFGALGALMTNPWTIGIAGAIIGGVALWKSGAFRGGEEALQVNPARDAFFQTFQDQFGGDQFSALAQAFHEAGVSGDIAERLIADLYHADEMDEFRAATDAIKEALEGTHDVALGVSDIVGEAATALTEFESTVADVEATGAVSQEAVAALRVAIEDLKTSGVSAETVEMLNTTLEQMIAEGTASDEAIGQLVDQVEKMTESSGDSETQIEDTTVATDYLTDSTRFLADEMYGGIDSADYFVQSLADLRYALEQPINMPPIIVPDIQYPDGGGGGGAAPPAGGGEMAPPTGGDGGGGEFVPPTQPDYPTYPTYDPYDPNTSYPLPFANEGIVSSPTLAIVGDAKEPEWILHQSSVMGLLQRGMTAGANMAYAMDNGGDWSGGGGARGGDQFYLTATINVEGAGADGRTLAQQLVTALPMALRRDDGLRRKIRGAVR